MKKLSLAFLYPIGKVGKKCAGDSCVSYNKYLGDLYAYIKDYDVMWDSSVNFR